MMPAVALQNCPCTACGRVGAWSAIGKQRQRLDSVIGEARCAQCGARAFIKSLQSGDAGTDTAEAARLFDLYRRLHQARDGAGQPAMPRPVHRQGPTLVFEWVAGAPLDSAWRRLPLQDAARLAERMGRWLAQFHAISGPAAALDIAVPPPMVEVVRAQWRGPARARSAAVERGLATIDRLAARLPAGTRSQGILQHGDAKPGNFLFDGEQLVGLDIQGRHWGPPENDLAQLAAQTSVSGANALGGLDTPRALRLSDAVVSGYATAGTFDDDTLRLYIWLYLLRWRADLRDSARLTSWPQARALDSVLTVQP